MTQRVTVQYSIPIDQLDVEITRLYDECMGSLHTAIMFESETPDEMLSLSTVDRITALREKLANADVRLAEVTSLINGYVSYKTQESLPPPQDISELQDKLNNFKQAFNEIEEKVADPD